MKIRKAIAIASIGLLLPLTACSALVAEGSSESSTSTTSTASDTTTDTEATDTESTDTTAEPPAGAPAGGEGGPGGADATTTATSTDDLDSLIETALGDAGLGIHRGHQPIETVLDEVLGITHDELHVRMDAGQNLAAVATDLGIDPQTLIDALVADFQPVIDQALADGVITEDQAADYTEQLEEAFTERVNYEA